MNYKLFFRKGNEIFEGEIMFDQDMLLSIISEDKKEAKEKELLDSLRMLLDEDISAITVSSIVKKIIDFKPENNQEEEFKQKIFSSIEYSYLVLTPSNGNKSFDDELSLLKKVSKKIKSKSTDYQYPESLKQELEQMNIEEDNKKLVYEQIITSSIPHSKK